MIEKGHRPRTKRLDEGTAWISLDFLDVVHIFTEEARDYYRLESLLAQPPRSAGRSSRTYVDGPETVHIL